MTNYKIMYTTLCAAMSAALDNLKRTPENECAIFIMSEAMGRAEDVYIESSMDDEE